MKAEFRFENLRKRRKMVMKKLLIALMAVSVLALGTAAYAHMWGGGPGWGGGGQHMWGGGPGYGSGPGMMYGYGDKESRKPEVLRRDRGPEKGTPRQDVRVPGGPVGGRR
jgi:hypothetical protein